MTAPSEGVDAPPGPAALLRAFAAVDFAWYATKDDVWVDTGYDVPSVNQRAYARVLDAFDDRTRQGARGTPAGVVVIGAAGSGKTHLASRLRRAVWDRGGTFVQLEMAGLQDFWRSASLSFKNALLQGGSDSDGYQGERVVKSLAFRLDLTPVLMDVVDHPERRREGVDRLVTALPRLDRQNGTRHREAFRAMLYTCYGDEDERAIADYWLQGAVVTPEEMARLGFRQPGGTPRDVVAAVAWLMSLYGPTLVVLDEIDGLVNQSLSSAPEYSEEPGSSLLGVLSAGLLDLHSVNARAMVVVMNTVGSWEAIRGTLRQAADRFDAAPILLADLVDAPSACEIVRARVAPRWASIGYEPPYPTWPFPADALGALVGSSPRVILARAEEHRQRCRSEGAVVEFSPSRPPVEPMPPPPGIDDLYEAARASAAIDDLLGGTLAHERRLGELVTSAFNDFVLQETVPGPIDVENRVDAKQDRPPLNARVTYVDRSRGDLETHFCFRAIEYDSQTWNAFKARMTAALTDSGVTLSMPNRRLFVLRRKPMPVSAAMGKLTDLFHKCGGVVLNLSGDDLRSLVALRSLRERVADQPDLGPEVLDWLRSRRPLRDLAFIKASRIVELAPSGAAPPPGPAPGPAPSQTKVSEPPSPSTVGTASAPSGPLPKPSSATSPAPAVAPPPPPAAAARSPEDAEPGRFRVGRDLAGRPVSLRVADLPRHVAVVAGSGSGKSMLLRRLVEEAAIEGCPAVVVDGGGDLSRLGEPWVSPPRGFGDDDAARATLFHERAEVVVWTPGIPGGRPLSLPVLPDLAFLREGDGDGEATLSVALDAITPIVGSDDLVAGVLVAALRRLAVEGGSTLSDLAGLLRDLPEGLTSISTAPKLALKMADKIEAALLRPEYRESAGVVRASELFGEGGGGRTRVSVVYLPGLGLGDSRDAFVARLGAELFAHATRVRSASPRLYVIDEAQNYVPSGRTTASKPGVMRIAAEGRKYGLGLVVATQMPKGIENRLLSNCGTLFVGRQNAPEAIEVARGMVADGGGDGAAIGRLGPGQFFATTGGARFSRVDVSPCLTAHGDPLTDAEAAARSRGHDPSVDDVHGRRGLR